MSGVLLAIACTDDQGPQQSTSTDPGGTETSGVGDGDGDGDGGDGDGEPAAVCGDGIVEGAEVCDDGNSIDADFCSNACTDCALEWVVEQPGISGFSIARGHLTVDGNDHPIVGSQTQEGSERKAWIGKYGPSGEGPLWELVIPGLAGHSFVHHLAVGPDDSIYAAGELPGDDGSDLWAARISSSGALLWLVTHDGDLDDGDDEGSGIAIAQDGVVVIGTVRDVDKDSDIWIRKLDFNGNELWTTTYSGPTAANGFSLDSGRKVTVGPDGRIYALGNIYVDYQTTDVVLLSYAADGSGPDQEIWPKIGGAHVHDGFALELDGAGSLYLAIDFLNSPVRTFWVDKYDLATGDALWSISNDAIAIEDSGKDWILSSLAPHPAGLVLLGWRVNRDYKPGLDREETWLAHFDGEGNPLCYAAHGRELDRLGNGGSTLADAVALTSEGHPVASGLIFTGDGFDRWLGMFGSS